MEGLTGVAPDCRDRRGKTQLSRQEVAENVRTITLRFRRTFPRSHPTTWPTHWAHGTEAAPSPPATKPKEAKAKAKAVGEGGDAPRHKVDRLRSRNVFPLVFAHGTQR